MTQRTSHIDIDTYAEVEEVLRGDEDFVAEDNAELLRRYGRRRGGLNMRTVRVDRSRCEGTTFCQAIAADHFRLDDDGIATVIAEDVAPRAYADVEEAARTCPTGAIIIETRGSSTRGASSG